MDGNRKQRAGQFPDTRLVEVLQILAGEDEGGILLPHALEAVADVGDHRRVGEPEVQFVDGSHGVARGQELVGHIGQQAEQQRVPQIRRHVVQALDTEDEEFGRVDVGMPVEKAGVGALAHGV